MTSCAEQTPHYPHGSCPGVKDEFGLCDPSPVLEQYKVYVPYVEEMEEQGDDEEK